MISSSCGNWSVLQVFVCSQFYWEKIAPKSIVIWRFERGNIRIQGHTLQCLTEKGQKNTQWSINTTLKTWLINTTTIKKNPGALGGREVSSSCSTRDTRRVTLVTNPVIGTGWGKDMYLWLTGHFQGRLWHIYNSVTINRVMVGDCQKFRSDDFNLPLVQ